MPYSQTASYLVPFVRVDFYFAVGLAPKKKKKINVLVMGTALSTNISDGGVWQDIYHACPTVSCPSTPTIADRCG